MINRSAVLHIPLSQYAFASSERCLTIRLRAAKDNLSACTLYYGDRACNTTPVQFCALPMEVMARDTIYDYYEITFESPFTRVCYYFRLESGEEWSYYYADQFMDMLPDLRLDGRLIEGRSEYYQYPFILRSEICDIPNWFKQAVVYNIFPDSFATGKRKLAGHGEMTRNLCDDSAGAIKAMGRHSEGQETVSSKNRLGGSIQGITDNLDYIEGLGFNCLYLNPIFVAGEYHKYDTLDYYHIDPCLGSDEDFRRLVEEVHKRNMHIVIDGVFNHCSWYFKAFDDVVRYGEASEYKDWFYELTFPVKRPQQGETPDYACFAYERRMPKLNTANPAVQEYFADVCRYWIEAFGVDGWRLDVANEIDRNFWRKFRQAAKEANPQTVLIGEVWENSETWLRGDAFDSTMNYDFRKHCREFFALERITAEEFTGRIMQMQLRYPTNIMRGQLNLLDSHDVPRFLSICENNMDKWKAAFVFLMMSPGVPSVFYGDELGISGITESEYRAAMPWATIEQKSDLLDFVRDTIHFRKQYVEWDADWVTEEAEDNGTVFLRRGKEHTIRVQIKNGGRQIQYNLI